LSNDLLHGTRLKSAPLWHGFQATKVDTEKETRMKIATAILSGVIATAFAMPALADHNSKFGDNTGRTVASVHDNRIDSNLKNDDNSTAMGQSTSSVQASGTLGSYAQSGHPATVVPGSSQDDDDGLDY
jgi:hypothetical protein